MPMQDEPVARTSDIGDRSPGRYAAFQKTAVQIRCAALLFAGIAILSWAAPASTAAQTPPVAASQPADDGTADASVGNDTDVNTLATSASNAQNNGDYRFAARMWMQVIEKFPDWSRIATANLNLGICQFQMKKYFEAIAPLREALGSGDTSLNVPKALLFLGFSQMKHGDQLAMEDSEEQRQQASIYLTTATQTLGRIVKDFPDYDKADQALYFQGQSFYKLGRFEESAEAFEQLASREDATFHQEAQYDLASTLQQLGRYDESQKAYEAYAASLDPENESDVQTIADVGLQIAKLNMTLASAATQRGDDAESQRLYGLAADRLQSLDRSLESSKASEILDAIRFNHAICKSELAEYDAAASLYQSVASMKTSPLAPQAAVLAGREQIRGGNFESAIETLRPAATEDSRYGSQAAILLSNALRNDSQAEAAVQLTEQWMDVVKGTPLEPAMAMENADSLYAVENRKKDAAARYLKIARDFPNDPVAPEAQFNATAALWESFQTDMAIESAADFLKQYPDSPMTVDVESILGDAWLVKEDFAAGEEIFTDLIRQHPDHPSFAKWVLRNGWAMYLQEKYPQTRQFLRQHVDTINDPTFASEAFHWIGASEYQEKDYPAAIASLQQSVESASPWGRADETLLLLMRSELAVGQVDKATATQAKLATQYPKSDTIAESIFRLGETLYDARDFPAAMARHEELIASFPDSPFVPMAMFGLGWSQLRSNQFADAEATFTRLIDDYPDVAVAQQARMGRSVARRKTGELSTAIADLESFLETAPEGDARNSSLFELGLAHVENEDWEKAEPLFRQLAALPKSDPLADRTRYELAWTLEAMDRNDQAMTVFRELATDFPTSPLAAEAAFKVASGLYEAGQFQEAEPFYETAMTAVDAPEEIREKAVYKLGWTLYQQAKYAEAATRFEQQIQLHSAGPLSADGAFMLAQSFFRQGDFEKARSAYRKAQPMLEASKTVPPRLRFLTMLHGAKSANEVKKFDEALAFAQPLTQSTQADPSLVHDAWFETGRARSGLEETEGAIDAYTRAAADTGKIGAHARVMKGDLLFGKKRFDEAIDEFKLVFYGYGGSRSTPDIQALQAYAVYEAARCSYVRISEASDRLKPKLVEDAIRHFDYLIENYPDQKLADDAKEQLATLKQLQTRMQ